MLFQILYPTYLVVTSQLFYFQHFAMLPNLGLSAAYSAALRSKKWITSTDLLLMPLGVSK
jgi:hypothetical protein